jgi:hypothetical protein
LAQLAKKVRICSPDTQHRFRCCSSSSSLEQGQPLRACSQPCVLKHMSEEGLVAACSPGWDSSTPYLYLANLFVSLHSLY